MRMSRAFWPFLKRRASEKESLEEQRNDQKKEGEQLSIDWEAKIGVPLERFDYLSTSGPIGVTRHMQKHM